MLSADADVRLARRIRRDTNEKDRDIGAVLDQVAIVNHTICTTINTFWLCLASFSYWLYLLLCKTWENHFNFMPMIGYYWNSLVMKPIIIQLWNYIIKDWFSVYYDIDQANILFLRFWWLISQFNEFWQLILVTLFAVFKICEASFWWLYSSNKEVCWYNYTSWRR